MKIRSALLTVLLLGVFGSAMAQWQWLDKDGRKVFSDRPPPSDIPEKSILKRPNGMAKPVAVQDAASAESQAGAAPKLVVPSGDKELEAKKKQIEKQAADSEAAKRKAEEDRINRAKAENCANAKQAMDNLNSGVRMSRTLPSGEREVMDDSAKASERARVQAIINSDCR